MIFSLVHSQSKYTFSCIYTQIGRNVFLDPKPYIIFQTYSLVATHHVTIKPLCIVQNQNPRFSLGETKYKITFDNSKGFDCR